MDGLDENGNQGTTELVDKTPEKTGKLLFWLPREFCDIHFVEWQSAGAPAWERKLCSAPNSRDWLALRINTSTGVNF